MGRRREGGNRGEEFQAGRQIANKLAEIEERAG